MKNIIPIILLYLPLVLLAQNSLEVSRVEDRDIWVGFRERIEGAVERNEITREQADERYAGFRRRMWQRNDKNLGRGRMNLNRPEQNTELAGHFKKLGISDLYRIKIGLLENGITDRQLDDVLRGMVRLIHGAKADGKNFEMNPRIQVYFQDRIGLNQEQVQYVMDISVRIAQRVR
tara:strand:- start:2603 stop:3130 length:528 start_codon:yes stop_codon:yes gene_type:complete